MTEPPSFSRAEWLLLADAPLAAAAAVALAEEGGGRQEAAAMVSGWREAAREYGDSPLVAALAAEMDPEDRAQAEALGWDARSFEGRCHGHRRRIELGNFGLGDRPELRQTAAHHGWRPAGA